MKNVRDRFLEYVAFETTSSETSTTVPSSPKELELAGFIKRELEEAGLKDISLSEYGCLYGKLPASEGFTEADELPVIGLIAHLDTSPDASGANIRPRIVHYEGGDILLNETDEGEIISESVFEFMKDYVGQDLIVTDGTTLLGADDKAGAAEIVTAVEYLAAHPEIPHGEIAVAFTPDEEIGCGTDHFELDKFGADFGYTVDGGALGELEYENFNAASAVFRIKGVNIHPGSAKNKMKNAVLISAELMSCFPAEETPQNTEGYEGFYHINRVEGDVSEVKLEMIIRDHDREKFAAKKNFVKKTAETINERYGEDTVNVDIKDSYYNMKEKILPVMHVVERAEKAMRDAGVTPRIKPIRGGTDGAMLSYKGLPCPNLSTGGENFHGVHEFVSVQSMEKMVEVIINLLRVKQDIRMIRV